MDHRSGPFQLDDQASGYQRTEALALELLRAARELSDASLAGRTIIPEPSIPGASPYERGAVSIALQSLFNASIAAGYEGFNIADGIAHGLAAILASKEPGVAQMTWRLIMGNVIGYEQRTRAALDPTAVAGRG